MHFSLSDNTAADMNSKTTIDWAFCLKLTGNRDDIANEMLMMFINELPTARKNIIHAYNAQDYNQMLINVHKLHGAACYCGVPRLKNLLSSLETSLKSDEKEELDDLMQFLESEIDHVINCYQTGEYKNN